MEVAWIDIAVVLDNQVVAAIGSHRADGGAACDKTRDNGVEKADGDGGDIIRIPYIEQLAEEVAPLAGLQGEWQGVVGIVAFNAFDVLMISKAVAFQIIVDLGSIAAVRFGDKREDVCLDVAFPQAFQASQNIRLTAVSVDMAAVAVMDGGRAV